MRRLFPFCLCLLLGLAASTQADPSAACSLSGTVCDRDGKLLAGVRLTLTPSGHSAMTDKNGTAVFTNLPPGAYTVSLAPNGYHALALPVTLAAGETDRLDFVLEKNGTSNVRIHRAAGNSYRITAPPVPRPVNPPPPEYLLTPPVSPGSGPAWRVSQEMVLREAVFRYLFALSPSTKHLPVYYLSLGGFSWEQGAEASQDPDPAFLARFQGSKPPVQAVSALLASSKDWNDQAKHHWIIFRVSSIKWTDDTTIEVACGSARSGFISSDSLFLDCALRHGKWEIIGITEVSA